MTLGLSVVGFVIILCFAAGFLFSSRVARGRVRIFFFGILFGIAFLVALSCLVVAGCIVVLSTSR